MWFYTAALKFSKNRNCSRYANGDRNNLKLQDSDSCEKKWEDRKLKNSKSLTFSNRGWLYWNSKSLTFRTRELMYWNQSKYLTHRNQSKTRTYWKNLYKYLIKSRSLKYLIFSNGGWILQWFFRFIKYESPKKLLVEISPICQVWKPWITW